MELTYTQCGGYLIPNLVLSDTRAVSYTHLDVYKRQASSTVKSMNLTRHAICARFCVIQRTLCPYTAQSGIQPVSYTHLSLP